MKYLFIAGEASGDIHAAGLIEAVRKLDPQAEIRFFGGDAMAAAAGSRPVVHYSQMAYMGFSQVISHLPDIKRNLRTAFHAIDTMRPDAVVLIDYPGFNLRVAAHARSRNVKTYYYIPPKVWAWKEHRVKAIRRDIDRVFSILPFETAFYRRHGMEVEYAGNPSVIEIDRFLSQSPAPDPVIDDPADARPLLALVPGSRESEVRNNLAVMTEVARRHPECRAVVAAAPSLPESLYRSLTQLPVVRDKTFDIMRRAHAALVTSGTATLECALIGTPQIACYRGNGSRLTYAIMSRWLKIPFVTLPNLIADREVIPEMLMHHCNPDEVDSRLAPLLVPDSPERTAQLQGYAEIRRRLGTANPAVTAARTIVGDCHA